MRKILLICALSWATLAPLPAMRRAAGGCDPGQCPAAADRHSRFSRRRIPEPSWAPISPAWCAPISSARACSSPLDPKAFVDHITNINVAPNFANWRVINAQGLVAGQVTAAARRPAARRFPAVGCLWRKPDAGAAILHHSRKTGGASRIWSRTPSMSASPARRAISTPASSSFRKSGPAIKRDQAAGGDG